MLLLVYCFDVLYSDDNVLHMLHHLQTLLNFCETKFVHTSETILLGSPYSEEITLHVLSRYLH